jgi:hypothetical protein
MARPGCTTGRTAAQLAEEVKKMRCTGSNDDAWSTTASAGVDHR